MIDQIQASVSRVSISPSFGRWSARAPSSLSLLHRAACETRGIERRLLLHSPFLAMDFKTYPRYILFHDSLKEVDDERTLLPFDQIFTSIEGRGLRIRVNEGEEDVIVRLGESFLVHRNQKFELSPLGDSVSFLRVLSQEQNHQVYFKFVSLKKKPRSLLLTRSKGFIYNVSGSLKLSFYPGEAQYTLQKGEAIEFDFENLEESDILLLSEAFAQKPAQFLILNYLKRKL